ncbi:MAG: hypothetical protein FE834_00985, partial [Gammaproteobacteria bacterium]|nr:hypothetical protein [Gammaproteobacteria bacterium]
LDDLIVGAYYADITGRTNTGKSYVVFGTTNITDINLSNIALGTGGFVINGEATGDWSGYSISCAGDVNGDGLDDLMVGAYPADSFTGKSYVIFGKINTTAINLSNIALGTGGFVINGEVTNDWSGHSVSCAGDVNGDGLDDLIIGAFYANPTGGTDAGKSYVIFGKVNTTAINLSTIVSGTGGFVINGEATNDWSGYSVSCAGDVNGDGLDDLIVGAYHADDYQGKSYVIFGKTDTTAINLSTIASGTGGFVIKGEKGGDHSGESVSAAGDVNGDGLDDLIVGAHLATLTVTGGLNAGKSYVIFGKTDTNTINLSALGGNSKYSIDYLGDETANTLTSTTTNKDEIFVAGAGDDVLTGNGGMDVFSAGDGNDTIIINNSNIIELERVGEGNRARVNGGGGTDTLQLAADSAGVMLDLTKIGNNRIRDIEKIDITGAGNNTLKLSLNNLLDASSSTNILKVFGDSGDTVDALGFVKTTGTETEGSITYNVWTHINTNTNAKAALWIQTGITVTDTSPNVVDLDPAINVQNTSTTSANLTQIGVGVAFDADIADATADDIKSIKVMLGGAGFNASNDKLLLDSEIGLDANANATNKTIGTVGSLKYTYTTASKTLLISKETGVFDATNIAKVVESIKLKNADTGSQNGIRTATISYIDVANNESISAIASLKVSAQRGFVMNGEAANDMSGYSVSSAGDV